MTIQKVGKLFTKQLLLNNGNYIPQIGLGCQNIDKQTGIETAIDNGYYHFDTANFYKNENWVGIEIYDHLFMRGYLR